MQCCTNSRRIEAEQEVTNVRGGLISTKAEEPDVELLDLGSDPGSFIAAETKISRGQAPEMRNSEEDCGWQEATCKFGDLGETTIRMTQSHRAESRI
jgi:hypothetical protein